MKGTPKSMLVSFFCGYCNRLLWSLLRLVTRGIPKANRETAFGGTPLPPHAGRPLHVSHGFVCLSVCLPVSHIICMQACVRWMHACTWQQVLGSPQAHDRTHGVLSGPECYLRNSEAARYPEREGWNESTATPLNACMHVCMCAI